MSTFLLILSVLSFLAGALVMFMSASAIHEIEAFVLFLIAATLLSAAGIIDAINNKKLELSSVEKLLERLGSNLSNAQMKLAGEAPSAPKSSRYHVKLESGTEGPYLLSDIRKLLEKGAISGDTLVREESAREWRSVDVILRA